jgi:predicted SAM-dependent methyltransferase
LISNYYHFRHLYQLRHSKKIIIGSSCTFQDGWKSTDFPEIDITSETQCGKYWKKGSKLAFFAEHVWEHLEEDDALKGARNCFNFLQNGGRVRIAVPDGNHPDPSYIEYVKPGGNGAGADDHKCLFTIEVLSQVFENAGLRINPLEYWDKKGNFQKKEWNAEWGKVRRSVNNDERNTLEKPYRYTSLIIDCHKDSK